jgi:N4-gp56 family major capsid protein
MADNLTTTAEIGPGIQTWLDRKLLIRAKGAQVHGQWAQSRTLPTKEGNTVMFSRYAAIATATASLPEGVNPPGSKMSVTRFTAQVKWYGDYISLTEEVELTTQDPVLAERVDVQGQQSGETIDELIRNVLIACASQTSCTGGSNGCTPTELDTDNITTVVQTLLNSNAKFLTSMIGASPNQGTSPIRPSYGAILHTELIPTLEACASFKNVVQYAGPNSAWDNEWGAVNNVRFLYSTLAYKTGSAPTYYKIPVIGQEAYAKVTLDGNIQSIFRPRNIAGGPLARYDTLGWTAKFAARILNDSFMHLIYCTNKAAT